MKDLLELLDQLLYLLEEHESDQDAVDELSLERRRELCSLLEGLARQALTRARSLRDGMEEHAEEVTIAARREELLQRGLDAIAHGLYADAERVLEAALEEFPDHDEYYNHLGLVAWERGDMVRAERYYARAADLSLMRSRNLDPTWADPSHRNYLRALEGRALCLYQLGRFEEAIELFELLGHTSVPDYQGCYYLAGEIYHLTGRLKRAIDCYTRAPVEPSVLYNLALAYYQLDDLERAATAFIRAFASNRFLADALLSRAPTASSPFTGYLSSPMYAEEFLQACRPLWRSASECLEFMERCYDHPLVQHQLWSVAAGQELTTDSLHGELLPDTKELQRVHSIAQRVLAGLVA